MIAAGGGGLSTTTRVLAGLTLGLVVGLLSTQLGEEVAERLIAVVTPVGTLWLNALGMTVVPLVFSLVVVGVAEASSAAAAGRTTGQALGLFIVLLVGVAAATALVAPLVYDLWTADSANLGVLLPTQPGAPTEIPRLADQFAGLLPANAIAAAAASAMVPLVLFALVFGFAVTRLADAQRLQLVEFLRAVVQAMLVIVGWVLKVAPIGVFALILPVAAQAGTGLIGAAGWFVLMQSCIQGSVLLAMYPVAALLGGVALPRFARAAAPAQVVAFGTQSSLASMPVMLRVATQSLGVPAHIAGIVLPLAVSLFRVTSPANTLGSACFVAWLYGVDLSAAQLASGAVVAIIVSVGSMSLPGQVTFAASHIPVLLAMGLPLEPVALMLALDPIPDAVRTVGNVTGDLAVTTAVARRRAAEAAPVAAAGVSAAGGATP